MQPVLIVHPADSNLKFFNKSIKKLRGSFKTDYLFLGPDKTYHEHALQTLKTNTDATVIFFCHGLDGSLRGCNRESAQRRAYIHGNFISASNISVLRDKRVFCMACDSKSLGELAIAAGVKVFMGFGLIRFSNNQKKIKRVSNYAKFEIRGVIETALINAYQGNFTFNQLSLELRRLLNKRINALIRGGGHPDDYIRKQVVVLLMGMKKEVTLFGNGFESVFING